MPVLRSNHPEARRARPFFARHPWVFDTSIQRIEGDPPAGAEVVVVSSEDKFVARGLYNPEQHDPRAALSLGRRTARRGVLGRSPGIGHPAPAVVLWLSSPAASRPAGSCSASPTASRA